MGVFDDKKFEELDWVSQAMEPIDSNLNEILAKVPDVIEIDFKTLKDIVGDSYGLDLSVDRAINYMLYKYMNGLYLSWNQKDALRPCFQFELEGDEVLLNFETSTITGGEIRLVKVKTTMDEKTLESILGQEGIATFSSQYYSNDSIGRMNEVMELLGKCEDGLRTRSYRNKKSAISRRLKELFKANEWKIKDTELANKVGSWIKEYVAHENLAAFSNFCRLKVMTHKDQPIYSMEEVE